MRAPTHWIAALGWMAALGCGNHGGTITPPFPDGPDTPGVPDAADPPDPTADAPTGGGAWTGLRVAGTGFVDGAGHEVILRGLGVGEWLNIESYMLDVELASDSPGLGETRLRNALVAAMGQAGADQFFARWEANVVTADDVALWASWGVNSVRVPLNYHALTSAPGVYLEAGFQRIDQIVAWCKAHGIYVILDLHAAPGAQNCEEMGDTPDGVAHLWKEPAKYRQWTIDLWQTIAKRYAGEPAVGGYDIFDEPYDTESSGDFSGGPAALRAMYVDITAAIRAVDADHVLFFEGTNWASIDSTAGGANGFDGLAPAWDPQMAWAFHKYWDANTAKSFAGYLALRDATQRPIWNGETGEDNSAGWSGAMIALCEANHVGWNMWTYKKVGNDTNFYAIPAPPKWSAMQAYLKGGAKPSSADANTIMMALADNAATSRCTLQKAWLKEIFDK
jgi:endoglucanase